MPVSQSSKSIEVASSGERPQDRACGPAALLLFGRQTPSPGRVVDAGPDCAGDGGLGTRLEKRSGLDVASLSSGNGGPR